MSTQTRLRPNCLNFAEVSAQAIALISPTMTAALIVPLMFGTAGTAGWLCYAFGTVMLLFVAMNLNQFAKRSTSAGSMYDYTVRGMGPTAGGVAGWCLIWAYLCIGMAGVTGFTHFAKLLLAMVGVPGSAGLGIALFAICVAVAWFLAYKDIQFSTLLMLALEGISVTLIVLLAVIVSGHTGVWDPSQLQLSGQSFQSIGLGVVVAIFSLVGFECATAFGEEAKNPLKTIPRAVIGSLLITGAFFVFITYLETLALKGHKPPLDQLDAPLVTLSNMMHMPWLGVVISAGAMVSFFALALSCLNAGARILFAMGRFGIFHSATAKTHASNLTPHVSLTMLALLMFAIPATATIASVLGVGGFHMAVIDAFNWAGTFGAFGFCGAYFLISIAAPMYLKKIGELKPRHIVLSVLAVLLLLVPAIGSVYPVPAAPVNYFPYIFLAYLAAGVAWIVFFRRHSHDAIVRIRTELEAALAHPAPPAQPGMPSPQVAIAS